MKFFDKKNIELMHKIKDSVQTFNCKSVNILNLISQQMETKNELRSKRN